MYDKKCRIDDKNRLRFGKEYESFKKHKSMKSGKYVIYIYMDFLKG